MPRAPPTNVVEQRVTLGNYERERLDALLEVANRDRTIDQIVEVATAALAPVGLLLTGYVVYQGMIHWATGVDGLRNRFSETPFGQYTDAFGNNIRRTHPVYRFITWGLGGENPPVVPEQTQSAVAAAVQQAGDKLADAVSSVVPDVSQESEGDGGGGGSRTGVFGGSVFM